MRSAFLFVGAAFFGAAWTLPAHAQAPAAPVPIEHFFANPVFRSAVLSPNARSLAVRFGGEGSRDRLAVIDLDKNAIKVVAQFKKMDIGHFQWVNNNRLVFDSTDNAVAPGDTVFAPGLYAVNRDGSDYIQLADARGDMVAEHNVGPKMLPPNTFLVKQVGSQDSDFVYVTSQKITETNPPQLQHVSLMRLNTLTGRTEGFQRPGPTREWLLDHQGEPRLVNTLDKNTETVYYRDPADKSWRKLVAFDGYVGGKGAFDPLAFAPDGTLYVVSNAGKDKFALHAFDVKTATLQPKPLIELADFDFSGKLITNKDKLLGIRYLSDAQATVWFDPAMKDVQAKIDAALPDTVNLVDVAARAETPWVLVTSYSDIRPSTIALFNTQTGKLNKVGDLMENIDPARMSSQELVRYKARDGLDIPAWLTIPKGAKRKDLPMVVLVHGGPFVRGHAWGWDAEVQFLASRGYAVLQPEFRGSTGYGVSHYRAGWKQWGLAMQNDIADGVRWAVAQGVADPKRVCIAGASYGGYAALMGLVNDPDLFACAVNWAGVTDINLLYTGHWSFTADMQDGWKQFGMPVLVGDQVKDAAQLKATSPLEQASRITKPVMLAYGATDQRVPLYHGRKFLDAVSANNKNVEWVLYNDEGHGWTLPKNRVDFWTRVEKFLERNIGKP